jgi:hypothetical protein
MFYLELELYSEIMPNLFQGGTDDFDTLEFPKFYPLKDDKPKFDSVATLYALAHPVDWGVKEMRFGFPDGELQEKDLPKIHAVADWVYEQWTLGAKTLVRCQLGANRSGLVSALVLCRHGMSPQEAISLIREKRGPIALSNPDFVRYLEGLTACV